LASYIGAGGLGDFIFTGLGMNDSRILIIGGASVALLSVISEMSLFIVQPKNYEISKGLKNIILGE